MRKNALTRQCYFTGDFFTGQWKLSQPYDLELVAEFRETGFVASKKRHIEPPVSNDASNVAIFSHITLDHMLETRKLATVLGISRTSIQ